MNNVGIIFAMKEELDETIKGTKLIKEHNVYELMVYECEYKDNKCFLVEAGIGKVNAARTTQLLINEFNVKYILNVGVAGSISRNVKKCDIVIAEGLVQHDYDLTSFGREKGFIPNVGKYIACDERLLKTAKSIKLETNIYSGIIASGDIFVSEENMGRKINEKFNALCVEMEGAAIAQVCYLCKIPFLVIRAISDSPYEKDNGITFDEFLKISSARVSKLAFQILENANL